jgi:LAO/AO transport system kinase
MASRGSLGGVSTTTQEASEVLDAAGFDWILIETVGVGQSELEIVELADTVVLVLVPESGDAVQVMKAGIMEIADVFVVNKYDREGGDRLIRDISVTMEITSWSRPEGWVPPICPAVATEETGIAEVLAAVQGHRAWLREDQQRLARFRAEKLRRRLRMLLNRVLLERAWKAAQIDEHLEGAVERILSGELSPYRWVAGIEVG